MQLVKEELLVEEDTNIHGHKNVLKWIKTFMSRTRKFTFRSLEFRKEMISKGWRLIIYMDEK